MIFFANYRTTFWRPAPLRIFVLALLTCGCTSNARSTSTDEKPAAESGSQIDINCIGNRLENPPEAFHYSYKSNDGQNSVDKEAEITPQNMDITIQDNSGPHKYHGTHSDEGSWSRALVDLSGSGFTVMSARVDFIKNTSSVTSAGTEAINGYQTTKYSIDTTAANSSDKQTFETMFGSGSYEKGTIWTTPEGCPVKLILSEARKQSNGNIDNFHFELAMLKK